LCTAHPGQVTNDILIPCFPGIKAYLIQVVLLGGLVFHTMEYHHPILGLQPYPPAIAMFQTLLALAAGAQLPIFAPMHWVLMAINPANPLQLYLGVLLHISVHVKFTLLPIPMLLHQLSCHPNNARWTCQITLTPLAHMQDETPGQALCLASQSQAYHTLLQ
jgi:hypothetical protein